MTSCYTEITKLCVISVYFFYYITSYVIPLKEAAFSIEGNCDMGLRRCLFQIKRRKKDEKIRSINSGRGADTCFVGGVPESKYGREAAGRGRNDREPGRKWGE